MIDSRSAQARYELFELLEFKPEDGSSYQVVAELSQLRLFE